MEYNDYNYRMDNMAPISSNIGTFSNLNYNMSGCNMPVRRHLEPVLVAKIYNQPIIEELPYSSMTLTLDNNTAVSNAQSAIMPMCDNICDDPRF